MRRDSGGAREDWVGKTGERRKIESIVGRQKLKKYYQYEITWRGMDHRFNVWVAHEQLLEKGFTRLVQRIGNLESSREGAGFLAAKPKPASRLSLGGRPSRLASRKAAPTITPAASASATPVASGDEAGVGTPGSGAATPAKQKKSTRSQLEAKGGRRRRGSWSV